MFEMTAGQARELAGFLMEAAEFAESVATTSSSHLFS
jgi:hypothetical protein